MSATQVAPTLADAVLEIENFLIKSFGRSLNELEGDLLDPHRVLELERALRQLRVWVRLLIQERWLLAGEPWRSRLRCRIYIRAALRRLDVLHKGNIRPLADRCRKFNDPQLTLAAATHLAKRCYRTMVEVRARLLAAAKLVAEPFEEAIKWRGDAQAVTARTRTNRAKKPRFLPRQTLRPRSWRVPQRPIALPSFVRTGLDRLKPELLADDAVRVLHFCLETLAITPTASDQSNQSFSARPWA